MGLKEKLATAAPTTWPAEGISEEEVRRIVEDTKAGRGVDVKVAEMNVRLDKIAELKDGWNGYGGAKTFSKELVEYCCEIVNELATEPFIAGLFIAPTACGSIQFEYEKENDDYLEFEIFEDRIKMYSNIKEKGEIEETWDGDDCINQIKKAVEKFYMD